MSTTYHEFDHKGKHVRFVYDEDYQSEGSWELDTEEETARTVADEQGKLNSGEYVALGCIIIEECKPSNGCHCPGCQTVVETDSLWGIVIENDTSKAEAFAKSDMDFSS